MKKLSIIILNYTHTTIEREIRKSYKLEYEKR